ncbi:hypothetical protein L6452_40968 [Arctium lappa]|uniref:Uncharacterized protein n=1 Tax=Arctium lappa TaxID=4217 RepID=A0ACB8XP17_ARCLA|nr:hypothetical protein L6452_40968 [Arctium lappa]
MANYMLQEDDDDDDVNDNITKSISQESIMNEVAFNWGLEKLPKNRRSSSSSPEKKSSSRVPMRGVEEALDLVVVVYREKDGNSWIILVEEAIDGEKKIWFRDEWRKKMERIDHIFYT